MEPSGRPGHLIPLKTTLETKVRDSTLEVYVTAVPLKQASTALNLVRKLIPDDGGLDFQHLRRFVKPGDVPGHVSDLFAHQRGETAEAAVPDLFLVVGSVNAISHAVLVEELSRLFNDPAIISVHVPLLAPTSQEQAAQWSSQYWPSVYKKSNPFGPHPSIVSRAEQDIGVDVDRWMDLAEKAARKSKESGMGEAVGVLIVERRNGLARPIALASDARWVDWPENEVGNITAHAALRAIAMIAVILQSRETGVTDTGESVKCQQAEPGLPSAEKKSCGSMMEVRTGDSVGEKKEGLKIDGNLEETGSYEGGNLPHTFQDIFRDRPLFHLEKANLDSSGNGNGYLCHDLEIYSTHEPCVMCSMAIVHSRFGRVVFGRRMQRTGGMCADNDLEHGLHWRKELNWTLLAWQWERDVGRGCSIRDELTQRDFHA